MSYVNKNHDAEKMCGQYRGASFGVRRCYQPARLKVTSTKGLTELFCNRHASYVRRGMGSSILAGCVRSNVATFEEVR